MHDFNVVQCIVM